MIKKGQIKITLKSDLCVSSGYAYAGFVDNDICYDSCGLPYIPGKRIKGCMREVAETILYTMLDEKDLNQIFGESGADKTKGIIISNAYIENYDDIYDLLKKIEHDFNSIVNTQKILEQFTHIQSQTALKDGVADHNTLRFTRVLNKCSPINKNSELVFVADITYDEIKEEAIENILKATRHIGLRRTRGLGNVYCELVKKEEFSGNLSVSRKMTTEVYREDKEYKISYVFTNTEPLMLSSDSDSHSEKYISGQRLLGYLAKKYLENENNAADSNEFEDLFLNGTVRYTNAYLWKNGNTYYPTPEYVSRLKKSKKLVNNLKYEEEKNKLYGVEYSPSFGNHFKKLKGKFVSVGIENDFDVEEVDMSVIYHHSQKGESRDGTEGILYSVEAIRQRQMFAGEIYVSGQYVETMIALLKSGDLQLGKSLTAQYGTCVIKDIKIEEKNSEKIWNAGTDIIVTFLSDTIFVDENGMYTVYADNVYSNLAEELGIFDYEVVDAILQTKEIYGYQSKWKLRKQPISAIRAGSCIVYHLPIDVNIKKDFVGERNLEGYGQIRIDNFNHMEYKIKMTEEKEDKKIYACEDKATYYVKELIKPILVQSILKGLCKETLEKKENGLSISSASLGRVTLMLKESLDLHKQNADKAFEDFVTRVMSIKRDNTRKELEKYILKLVAKDGGSSNSLEKWQRKNFKLPEDKLELVKQLKLDVDEIQKLVNDVWGEYLLLLLTNEKYMKKLGVEEINE